MNLADSRMDCLRGCLATLSVLVVRIYSTPGVQ